MRSRFARRRNVIITLAASIALAAGAVVLIGKFASYTRLLDNIRDADWRWLPVCALGEVLAYLGYIVAYRDIARVDGGPDLPYRTVGGVVATSFGAFVVTSAGGPAVDFWALTRAGLGRNDAVTRVLALNTLKFGVLGAAAAVSAAVVLLGAGEAPLYFTLPWLVVVPVCVALALFLTGPGRGSRFARAPEDHEHAQCGLRGFEHCVRYLIREGLHDAVKGVVYVRHVIAAPVRYAGGAWGYPLYWAGDVLCLWGGLRAFGAHIGIAAIVLAYATGYVATSLPLPAGGAGGVEAAMTYALHAVGVPLAPALLGVAVYRLVNFWLPILPATAVLPALRRIDAQLRAAGRPEPAPA